MTNFSERFAHLGRTVGRSVAVLALALPLLAGGASAQTTDTATVKTTDLAVTETIDLSNSPIPAQGKFYVGQRVKYILTASNNGPSAANNAVLKETTEAGLEDVQWSCVGQNGAQCPAAIGTGLPNFAIPVFPAGSDIIVTYTAKVTAEDPQLRSTSNITPPAGVIDSNPVNNTDQVYICAGDPPRLNVTKASNGPWAAFQSGATYTLTVKNLSGFADTSGLITLTDQLPRGIGAALASRFSPAAGWICSYSGEAEQNSTATAYAPDPNEAQLLTCTTNNVIPKGGTVTLTIPVTVTGSASGSLTNRASIGGGSDPQPLPDPVTCILGEQCAENTTLVTARPDPIQVCAVGQPVNLLSSVLRRYDDNDNATIENIATFIPAAETYTAAGANNRFVIDGGYYFNNGYGPGSNASTLQVVVNGTSYATLRTEAGYSGQASGTAENGATFVGGATTLTINRYTFSRLWLTLPADVKSITAFKLVFKSSSAAGEVGDDFGYDVKLFGCVKPTPAATVAKTVQNISSTPIGPVGTTGTGKPGEVLEYCITTTNTGNVGLGNLGFGDNVPANTTFKVGAYGAGKDIRVTYPTGDTFLTSAADADKGVLAAGRVTVNPNNFVLVPSAKYTVCFRATIG
ncbi:hypothetical protein E7T06_17030 [Deinococcus sp. Arct2-2]|uniref:DUF11 domain-containing protein n=1 Tax=Deinococcus sp. Arct2-2 TaxID=2568653 RepID=UPI0010A533B9|nr:DUF11 domain-containing protein [Deinococcus sp. Arct2-2]THF68281.1 hypothetical protein E7T06_17030 [Deinococcus sp. Arct2-2]